MIICILWLLVLLVLPLFTLLGKVLPSLEFIHGIGENTWLSLGYLILLILAPIATIVTGVLLSFQKPRTKVKMILGVIATLISSFLVYLFSMLFGFFVTGFLDNL